MVDAGDARHVKSPGLAKAPTGIQGLDEITEGGLPQGRPTLICGGAGSGKTLFSIEFLAHGARHFHEPGVMMAFDETGEELSANVSSLGLELEQLIAEGKIFVDHVLVERSEIRETGEYSLEGLFVRLGEAIRSIGAKRVALDSLENLFAGLNDTAILRSELRRLFRWLKEQGVTAMITAERGETALTRYGLEEYISDCVIVLDHRVVNQLATRRLRVVKYRGSRHGTDEFPFLIGDQGISILPITSAGLDHLASTERVSSGIAGLDEMLEGKGFYRGSSILVTGTAGTGKTTIAAHLVDTACRRGERCLFFQFEEASAQVVRNLRSVGIDLQPWIDRGLLRMQTSRPTVHGLESHLVAMHRATEEFQPHMILVDPITNLSAVAGAMEANALLTRLIDYFKREGITAFFTSLTHGGGVHESSDVMISSLMDTWILLRDVESDGERNRILYVLKSRGMAHSNQVREFVLTSRGIELVNAYVGPGGVLTGSARLAQESREAADVVSRRVEYDRRRADLERRCQSIRSQMEAMRLDLVAAEQERELLALVEEDRLAVTGRDRAAMARKRSVEAAMAAEAGRRSQAHTGE